MAAIPDDCQSSVEVFPPRFWWIKRTVLACGALLFLLVCLNVVWNRQAHARLQGRIDEIIARGEPLFPRDFSAVSESAERTAARLNDASNAITLLDQELILYSRLERLRDLVAEHRATVANLVERTGESQAIVRQSRERGLSAGPAPPVDGQHAGRNAAERHRRGELRLMKTLCLTALYRLQEVADTQSIQTLRDALWVSEQIGRRPSLNTHASSLYAERWVVYYIEELSRDFFSHPAGDGLHLRLQDSMPGPLDGLIADLLDDRSTHGQFVRAVQAERMRMLGHARDIGEGRGTSFGLALYAARLPLANSAVERLLFGPVHDFDAARMLHRLSSAVHASAAPNWPAVEVSLPPKLGAPTQFARLTTPLNLRRTRDIGRYAQLHFRTLALRRMAAVVLAIRSYEIEHDGWPDRLDELVPDHLPYVPLDPFGEDERRISYAPDAEPPLLYSIGLDGIDEGGTLPPNFKSADHWRKNDLPFFINGNRPW